MALEAKKQTCHPDSGAQSISVPLTSEDTQLSVLKSILIELKLIREDTNKLCATQQSLKTEVEILRSEFKNVEDVLHSFSGSGVTEVDLTAVNDRGVNLTLAPPLGDGTEVVTTLESTSEWTSQCLEIPVGLGDKIEKLMDSFQRIGSGEAVADVLYPFGNMVVFCEENCSQDKHDHRHLSLAARRVLSAMKYFNNIYEHEELSSALRRLSNLVRYCPLQVGGLEDDISLRMDIFPNGTCLAHLNECLATLDGSIEEYINIGLPLIKEGQEKEVPGYFTTTATIAAFVSAVTVSMLQITLGTSTTSVEKAVNTTFFSSLLFSITGVMQGILVAKWKRATLKGPHNVLSGWLLSWLVAGPTAYVLIAGFLFYVGLCLLVFSSSQGTVTRVIVITIASFQFSVVSFFVVHYIHAIDIRERLEIRRDRIYFELHDREPYLKPEFWHLPRKRPVYLKIEYKIVQFLCWLMSVGLWKPNITKIPYFLTACCGISRNRKATVRDGKNDQSV